MLVTSEIKHGLIDVGTMDIFAKFHRDQLYCFLSLLRLLFTMYPQLLQFVSQADAETGNTSVFLAKSPSPEALPPVDGI